MTTREQLRQRLDEEADLLVDALPGTISYIDTIREAVAALEHFERFAAEVLGAHTSAHELIGQRVDALEQLAGLLERVADWHVAADTGDSHEVDAFLLLNELNAGFDPSAPHAASGGGTEPA
jgi:hypothetical protein